MTASQVMGAEAEARPPVLGQSALQASVMPPPRYRPWLLYPVIFVLFVLMGQYSVHPAASDSGPSRGRVQTSSAVAAASVAEGSPMRRIAIVALAVVAALTWGAARQRRARAASVVVGGQVIPGRPASRSAAPHVGILPWLLAGYVGLAAVSWTWADDAGLTARRVVVFLIIAFAAFAVAQAWSLRDVIYFTIFANATSLILGIGGAIARGEFTPWTSDFRFVGFANPNLHGIECACLAIAAAAALRLEGQRRRGPLIALFVFALVMIVLTKSRTAIAALAIAAAAVVAVSVRRNRLATVGIALAALVFAIVVFSPEIVDRVHNVLLLGRSAAAEDPSTLSGRTVLWSDLLDWAAERPLLGYGFDSFWSPTHINVESLRRGWTITQAHSGYVDTLLGTGWVGVSTFVLILLVGLRAAIKRFHSTRSAVALFGTGILMWYAMNLMAEAIPLSHFSTFVVMVVLAHFALRNAAPDDADPPLTRSA